MFVPAKTVSNTLVVLKSTFIAFIIPFFAIDSLNNELNKIKAQYPKAHHYLYAYCIDKNMHSNDDYEPNAVAKNILALMQKRQLNKTLIVVVRYFGGVKLGAARLLRTYLNAVVAALNNAIFLEEKIVYRYHMTTNYQTFNKLKALNYQLENISFAEMITCDLISEQDILLELKALKINNIRSDKVRRFIQSTNHQ